MLAVKRILYSKAATREASQPRAGSPPKKTSSRFPWILRRTRAPPLSKKGNEYPFLRNEGGGVGDGAPHVEDADFHPVEAIFKRKCTTWAWANEEAKKAATDTSAMASLPRSRKMSIEEKLLDIQLERQLTDPKLMSILLRAPSKRTPEDVDEVLAKLRPYFASNPLFSQYGEAVLRGLVRGFTMERFQPNEVVFLQGDAGDKFYIVASGCIRLVVEAKHRLPLTTPLRAAAEEDTAKPATRKGHKHHWSSSAADDTMTCRLARRRGSNLNEKLEATKRRKELEKAAAEAFDSARDHADAPKQKAPDCFSRKRGSLVRTTLHALEALTSSLSGRPPANHAPLEAEWAERGASPGPAEPEQAQRARRGTIAAPESAGPEAARSLQKERRGSLLETRTRFESLDAAHASEVLPGGVSLTTGHTADGSLTVQGDEKAEDKSTLLNHFPRDPALSALQALYAPQPHQPVPRLDLLTPVPPKRSAHPTGLKYSKRGSRVLLQDNNQTQVLTELGPLEGFGELALVTDNARSASAIAVETTHLFALPRAYFEPLLAEHTRKCLESGPKLARMHALHRCNKYQIEEEIARACVENFYAQGQIIWPDEMNTINMIVDGHVQLCKLRRELLGDHSKVKQLKYLDQLREALHYQVLGDIRSGDHFGEGCFFPELATGCMIRVMRPTHVLCISRLEFNQRIHGLIDPELQELLLQQFEKHSVTRRMLANNGINVMDCSDADDSDFSPVDQRYIVHHNTRQHIRTVTNVITSELSPLYY